MDNLTLSLLAVLIAVIGSTLQGSAGFGLGLFSVPLLVLLDPVFVPGPVLLAAFILNLMIAFREKENINFRNLRWTILGRGLGTIAGAALLAVISRQDLAYFIGGVVLTAVFMSAAGFQWPLSRRNLFGAGALSGLFATTAAVGGPPVAILYQRQKGPELRGTLSGLFIFGTVLSILGLTAVRRFGIPEIHRTAVLLPGIVLGFFFSGRTAKWLDHGLTRPAVLIISAVSGLAVLLKNLL